MASSITHCICDHGTAPSLFALSVFLMIFFACAFLNCSGFMALLKQVAAAFLAMTNSLIRSFFDLRQYPFSIAHDLHSILTMLRLDLSRIQLEKKDLDFHKETHQRRQNVRIHCHPAVGSATGSSRKNSKRNKSSKSSLSQSPKKNVSASPVKLLASGQNQEDSLISRDPVPRGSRAFWDKVLAEAGTPTRTQSTGSGNGRVFDPSDEWLDNNRSTRASVEEAIHPEIEPEEDCTSIEYTRDLAPTHKLSSSDSFHSTSTLDYGVIGNGRNTSLESIHQPLSRKRLSNFFRQKSKSVNNVEEAQPYNTTDLGLDGHRSDMHRYHDQDKSTSTETSQAGLLGDGLYGSPRDRRKISASLDATVEHDDVQQLNPLSGSIQHTQPISLSPIQPLPVDSLRRPSSTLPRSPLYISQAAISSSPEKSQAEPSGVFSPPTVATPNLVSLPPRRRRTYRPRSETYSFVVSEASSSATAQVDPGASSPVEASMHRPLNPPSSLYLPSISAESHLSTSSIGRAEYRPSSTNYVNSSPPVNPLPLSLNRFSSRSSSRIELPGNPFHLSHSGRTSRSSSNIQYPPTAPRSSPQTPVEVEGYRSVSHGTNLSNASSHSISSRRNLSPYAPPFVPRSARTRNLTPQYPLPPPFGATTRTVSYSRAIPTSISSNAFPSTFPISPQTPPRRQRSIMGSTPHTPPRSTFTIYNDSQTPHTQPQTPADFHRPPQPNLINTAPARSR